MFGAWHQSATQQRLVTRLPPWPLPPASVRGRNPSGPSRLRHLPRERQSFPGRHPLVVAALRRLVAPGSLLLSCRHATSNHRNPIARVRPLPCSRTNHTDRRIRQQRFGKPVDRCLPSLAGAWCTAQRATAERELVSARVSDLQSPTGTLSRRRNR